MKVNHERRRMLLAGLGAAGAIALSRRSARADMCMDVGPVAPTGPTMRNIYDKIAVTDEGKAEARVPITSLSSSATALYVVSIPGVYYMTGNITVPAGMSAIEVTTDNAEIEFDGFTIFGNGGGAAVPCIRTPSPQRCLGFYDGGISNWRGNAIDLSNSEDCYLEECWFDHCDASGSPVGGFVCSLGSGGTIDDCNAMSCIGSLMMVADNGIIEECVNINGTGGCFASTGRAVIEDNFALNNNGPGITVFNGSVVIGNRLVLVGGTQGSGSCVIAENDITGCPGTAITVTGSGSNIEENHISECLGGIDVLSGGDCVIDGNQMSRVASGVFVAPGATRCFVVRNYVRGNPGGQPYDIAPGNSYGTVVVAEGIGDLGGSGTAIDAWSNFQY